MEKSRQLVCMLCQKPVPFDLTWQQLFSLQPIEEDLLCKDCQQLFSLYGNYQKKCCACGGKIDASNAFCKSYTLENSDEKYCLDCFNWRKKYPLRLIKHYALFEYNETFKEWIYRYKYQGDCRLAEVMKNPLKKIYKKYSNYLWVVLPSSQESMEERLFHPTAYLLEIANIPYRCPFIYVGNGLRQAEKKRSERLNFTHPFTWTKVDIRCLKEKAGIIIFDDVYTTGSTILQAKLEAGAKCHLIKAGEKEMISFSLARKLMIT
ncbi:ComF family protein [Facklamia miroungae]|uniref:Competence protein ComFC n=1 Tax=Facklamia miroungae TaxID=120956 RepID=A0A1G7SII8_9LACT|nr:ComF family protein [Facklamia miroungae]NKZ29656.1 ComF family protein [Facklamia miroungae]SDG22239.1 competence protein ComFC [Facklamia miroungae]